MSEHPSEQWLNQVARSFYYPATPDVAEDVRRRLFHPRAQPRRARMAWAVVLLMLLVSLLAAPAVRAALRDFFRLGAITIFVGEPPVPPTATPVAALGTIKATPQGNGRPTASPSPAAAQPLVPATPISLTEAAGLFAAPLKVPAYPPDLDTPDRVYVHEFTGDDWPALIAFVWYEAARPERARLSLYQIQAPNFGYKLAEQVAETTVNGRRAAWIDSPHFFRRGDGSYYPWQFVEGTVLLWEERGVTYRLEGASSLEAAVRIAESLRPLSLEPESGSSVPESCPVTRPPDPPFIPPAPYPARPLSESFWYGSPDLWTMLPADGAWFGPGQSKKLAWWREGFDGTVEQQPALSLSARRLDGPAPEVQSHPRGTNALVPDYHWAMLSGMDLPMAGCWEITGHYHGHELSYVIWAPP